MTQTDGSPSLIGQRINVCYREVRESVSRREASRIVSLARQQVARGARALDICCADCDDEADALVWMARTVQRAVDITLCLDSAHADVLLAAAHVCVRPPIINAVSISHVRIGGAHALSQIKALRWIISAFDPVATEYSPEARLQTAADVARALVGVPESLLIFDPLFLPSLKYPHAWDESCITAKLIGSRFPATTTLCAIGNVSFGAANRPEVDRNTTDLAVNNGFDWLLCDIPTIHRPS